MNIFEKWDNTIKTDDFAKEVQEYSDKNGSNGDYEEVPVGRYEVKVEKLDLVSTKKGDKPMVTIWFKILTGKFKNSLIFMNQVVEQPFQLHIAKEFLKTLDSGLEVTFDSFTQFHNLLLDIHEAINKNKLEYGLDYGVNDKGYNTYKITDVFES